MIVTIMDTETKVVNHLPLEEFKAALTEAIQTPYIIGLARRFKPRGEEPEDLISMTYIRALEKYQKFEQGSNMKAWLGMIMRNYSYTIMRKRHRREVEITDNNSAVLQNLQKTFPIGSINLELQEVMRAVNLLPKAYREPFEKIYLEEMSYEEVAIALNRPLGGIKSSVSRALDMIHSYFN